MFSGQEGVAFQGDGKTFVTYPITTGVQPGGNNGVQVWDIENGRLLRTLNSEPLAISSCAVSPDGKQIAVAGAIGPITKSQGQCEIRVFDLPSGDLAKTVTQHNEIAIHLAVEAHGTIFTWNTAFSDKGKINRQNGFLRIHEIASGKELQKMDLSAEVSAKMALSGNGKYLAFFSGLKEGKLSLWDSRGEHTNRRSAFGRGPT